VDHKPIPNNKIKYYKDLLNRKDKEKRSIFEAIADKLLVTLEMNVLDFDNNPKKEVFINRIRYNENVLLFKRSLKLDIEKFEGGFSIYQKEFSILVSSESFQKALIQFQEIFFSKYKFYSSLIGKTTEEIYLIELYTSLVITES